MRKKLKKKERKIENLHLHVVRLLIFLHDVFLVKLYFLEVFLGELVYFFRILNFFLNFGKYLIFVKIIFKVKMLYRIIAKSTLITSYILKH